MIALQPIFQSYVHASTDPHSKINRRQEVDIYYKGIGILEMSKVFDSRQ